MAILVHGVHLLSLLNTVFYCLGPVFSERELMFMFAICRRASVCRLSVVCLSVCRLSVSRLSVTLVHSTQPIEIFGNVSAPCNTLVT